MFRFAALLLFQSLILLCTAVVAAPLMASETSRDLSAAEVSILRDPGGRLGIEDVSGPASEAAFRPLASSLSLGFTHDVIWLRLKLQRDAPAPRDWRLEVMNPYINDLRLFHPAASGFASAQAGDRHPFAERAVAFHHPVFEIMLPDEAPRTFYLRLQSDSTLAAPLVLWEATTLRNAAQARLLLFGGIGGLLAMSFLISGMNWLLTRERQFLEFAGVTVLVMVMIMAQVGLLAQLVLPSAPLLADLAVPWTWAFGIAAILHVMKGVLGIPQDHPWADRVLRVAIILSLLAPVTREVALYARLGGPLLQIVFLGGSLLLGVVAWQRWRLGKEAAGVVLFAYSILLLSVLAHRLVFLGILPANFWLSFAWIPGLAVFLVLTHMGVILNVRHARNERRRAEQAAAASQVSARQEQHLREEQTRFFSFVAHELRTPLGTIVAGLKNLARELADADATTRARLARLAHAAERMGALVERHLQMQRLASADFSPRLRSVPPVEPAAEALLLARESYPRRTFDMSTASDLPALVSLDSELLVFALDNLLINAAKYSPEDTPVRLELSVDSMLRYRVIDGGPGIPPEQRERLFEVFRRADDTGGKEGFGIGLAFAARIARLHGGRLEYSDGSAGGAVFMLSLPLAEDPGERSA